jgi:hypothetical protein
MKNKKASKRLGKPGAAAATLTVLFLTLFVCSCTASRQEVEMEGYFHALGETEPGKINMPDEGSAAEKEAFSRFTEFYQVFSEEVIRKDVRNLYAPEAYFRDPFKGVEGIEEIEEYFLKSAETIHECTFDIVDVAGDDGEYYFRWIMNLTLKRYRDKPIRAVGMSHVRFDEKGMVVFHQDYWDSGVIFDKVFGLGSVIRWIKGKF